MIRKLGLMAVLFFAVSFAAHAQVEDNKFQVYGGYSFLHFSDNGSFNQNGWELQGQYKIFPFLGAVADFSGDYGNGVSTHYFLFGPEVHWPARVSPFAHVLIGAAHVGSNIEIGTTPPIVVSASDTSFATAVGGGIDTRITHGVYWRIFQADYIHSSAFGGEQNNVRVSTGIVVHF
jgi:opacity protein-like surface antigen